MQHNKSGRSRDELRITSAGQQRGWQPSGTEVPRVGDQVYCTEGAAEVMRVLGRTSDGSRLLELRCAHLKQPFFAASSNVLVRSAEPPDSVFLADEDAVGASER